MKRIVLIVACLFLVGCGNGNIDSKIAASQDELVLEAFEYGYLCAGSTKSKGECLETLKRVIKYEGE